MFFVIWLDLIKKICWLDGFEIQDTDIKVFCLDEQMFQDFMAIFDFAHSLQ